MKRQISRFSVHQCSKIVGLIYFVLFLLVMIPLGIISWVGGNPMTDTITLFLLPFLYGIVTYIGTIVLLALYNWIAKYTGGLEFTVHDVEN